MRYFFSIAVTALLVPLYLIWGRSQAEIQIDKMQEAAFDTPGAEAPVTAPILLAGVALVGSHFVWCRLLGLQAWQAISSLIAAMAVGIYAFVWRLEQDA
jgi:hypothetical protein